MPNAKSASKSALGGAQLAAGTSSKPGSSFAGRGAAQGAKIAAGAPKISIPKIKLKLGGGGGAANSSMPGSSHRSMRQVSVSAEGFDSTPVAKGAHVKTPMISFSVSGSKTGAFGAGGAAAGAPAIHRKGGQKRPIGHLHAHAPSQQGQPPAKKPRVLELQGSQKLIKDVLRQLSDHPFAQPFRRSFYARGPIESRRAADWKNFLEGKRQEQWLDRIST